MLSLRPHVTLNVAITVDGKTDTVVRRGATISSPHDLERVDHLRANSDAIMVGGYTLLGDDPRLTVKSASLRAARKAHGLTVNPIKVGIVTKANIRPDSRFLTSGPARTMLFTTHQTEPEQIHSLRACGAEVFVLGEERVDVAAALSQLRAEGVQRLLVEGGGTLNAELLKQGLVDELFVYIAPLIFGGSAAPTFADGPGFNQADAIQLKLLQVEMQEHGGILASYAVL